MLDTNLIESLIALVFIYLLLSLGVSTIVEIFAQIRSLRAKKLQLVIESMLDDVKKVEGKDKKIEIFGKEFYSHSIIKNFGRLTKKKILFFKTHLPSYLNANNFSTVLLDLIIKNQNNKSKKSKSGERDNSVNNKLPLSALNFAKIKSFVNELPADSDLKRTLETFFITAKYDFDNFKKEIENWYDNTMERFTGYYKRHSQLWLFILGLLLCIFLNADTINILDKLSKDPVSRMAIVEQATQYVQDHQDEFSDNTIADGQNAEKDTSTNEQDGKQFLNMVDSLRMEIINDDLKQVKTVLGMGWHNEDFVKLGIIEPKDKTYHQDISFGKYVWIWFLKIIGILFTTLAIYLGAPFWFDLLKKFVNLRSAGKKPVEKKV